MARVAVTVRAGCVEYVPVAGLGEITQGTDIAMQIVSALSLAGHTLASGDVVVVTQKIVSKAAGRTVALDSVSPSDRALQLARECAKDPRFVEVVLRESSAVIRVAPNVLITRHRRGFIMANAGVDQSNLPGGGDGKLVLLLPADPDVSAHEIRERIFAVSGVLVGVIVSDSFGRPWREGVINVAIGAAGVPSLIDRRGSLDREGRRLQVTRIAWADAVAAAAGLIMGEAAEGIPVACVRGLTWGESECPASSLVRAHEQDLFA